MSITVLFSLILLGQMQAASATSPGFEGSQNFESRLSALARDEIQIVARMASLRQATERLAPTWKAAAVKPGQVELSRDQLLAQLSEMESAAAERWSLLLNNLAYQKINDVRLSADEKAWRAALAKLPPLHQQINGRLNEFNARLKDGILLNMANKLQQRSTASNSND